MKKNEIIKEDILDSKPHITEILNEHPLIQWVVDNRTTLLYIFVGLIAAIIVITRFSMGTPGQKEADFIKAESDFVNIQRSILGINTEMLVEEATAKIHQLLKKYPELNSKYDAPIAQAFIATGNITEAQPLADQALKRTSANNLTHYHDFAKASLLIENEQYQDALTVTQKINESLSPTSALYAFNVLRIALLHQALGNKTEELKTWQEFKNNLNLEAFSLINSQLESGGINLSDYIKQRI